jgi:hypothetical protein
MTEKDTKIGAAVAWDPTFSNGSKNPGMYSTNATHVVVDHRSLRLPVTEKEANVGATDLFASMAKVWRWDAPDRSRVRNVPLRHDVHRIASKYIPPQGKALDAVTSFLRWRIEAMGEDEGSVPGLLVLLSSTGTGKTSAGGWAVTWNHASALYTTAAKVPVRNLATFNAWQELVIPDLLVIDELGRNTSERVLSIMDLILDRDSQGLATILLSTLSREEFMARYVNDDESVASRMEQQRLSGFDPIVSFTGDDMRLARAQ